MVAAVARLTFRIPVIGWMLKDALFGYPEAKYYFIFNVLTVLAVTVYIYGYPALIIFALSMTGLMLVGLVILTGSDLVEQARRTRSKPHTQATSRLSLKNQD